MVDREKVIKGFEVCIDVDGNCYDCPYTANGEDPEDCNRQALKDALSLLKAQEPKPPRFTVAYDKIFYACDKCGKSLLVVANAEGIKGLSNMPKYCPECGQAVKWDEPPKEG